MNFDRYLITIDVDWASDEVIRACARPLIESGVKATWLVTHDSDAIQELAGLDDIFELGIHPNFHPGSTQGDTPQAAVEHLLEVVPGARTVRTHGLYQSTRLLRMMVGEYGIENDLSLLLPDTPHISPHRFHLPEGVLRRFPTFWEDDAEMLRPHPSFHLNDAKYHVPGLKVFTFHPILVALNAVTLDAYTEIKAAHEISRLTLDDIEDRVNRTDKGNGTFFAELIDHIAHDGPSLTVAQLARQWDSAA